MVHTEQIERLIEYLEGAPELALNQLGKNKEGRAISKRRWAECAEILNGVSDDCPKKSPDEWRTFYTEYKCKTLKKVKAQRAQMKVHGGRYATRYTLTPLQERMYNILQLDYSNIFNDETVPEEENDSGTVEVPVTKKEKIDSSELLAGTDEGWNSEESNDSSTSAAAEPLSKFRKKDTSKTSTPVKKVIHINSDNDKSPYAAFGEHIASKLNSYDSYTRAHVEFKISKILYEADMGMLHDPLRQSAGDGK